MNWDQFKEKYAWLIKSTSNSDMFYVKYPKNQITVVYYDQLGHIAKRAFEELEYAHLCFESFDGHYAKAYYLYIYEDGFDEDAVKAFDVCLEQFQLMNELQ